ncbi:unnamed protein product [Callosobruchus maculatus]|uniref:Uncharacterized protein n=1 Tax=Callosobruchus maculatus TaxID=64391 RepID=A0A653DWB9_CALMS|nr:unnamed protein product [Callosobruchus maculatus]
MSDSEEEIKEKQLKLVFVGEPNVGKVIILVYDITDCDSFDNMAIWIEKIKEDVSDPLIAVFANKCDLEHKRAVRLDKTKKFIEQYGLHTF